MKNIFVMSLFMLASLAWAAAQQPSSVPDRSSGQTTSPSSKAPSAGQSQPSTPGTSQGRPGSQPSDAPVTEGCLGGRDPNYTITDKAGTTYKLNMPPNADASKLASHVGESVQVLGEVKETGKAGPASINVQGVGRGTSSCSANTQSPPKQ